MEERDIRMLIHVYSLVLRDQSMSFRFPTLKASEGMGP